MRRREGRLIRCPRDLLLCGTPGSALHLSLTATTAVPADTVHIAPARPLPVLSGMAPALTCSIHVPQSRATVKYPKSSRLTDDKVAHWAPVWHRAIVRAEPRAAARRVTVLDTWTTDDAQSIVLVLARMAMSSRQTWYRVRLPILPNDSVGRVQSSGLGDLYEVHTQLYVDRERAWLERDGETVFRSIVGVGKSYWLTPAASSTSATR